MEEQIRVRFAPSPTGLLHVGNARTALFNFLFARQMKGTFILRLEDTDAERSTAEAEKAILEDLRWLGLDWDEGPDRNGDFGPYRQSERLEIYRRYAQDILEKGQAYRCYCTPEELEEKRKRFLARGIPPKYDGRCRHLTPEEERSFMEAGRPASLRFLVQARRVDFEDLVKGRMSFDGHGIGDFTLLRSDGTATYNFAVVVDDALMQVTHVIRGEDHLTNTSRQVLLYQTLGFPLPKFAHLSMILGPDRSPLSKRHGATSVAHFREEGILTGALANYLALLGWSAEDGQEIFDLEELTKKLVEEFKQGELIAKKLELSFKTDGSDFKVRGDAEKIRQVVSNLLDNALKYTPQGYIKVSLKRNETKKAILLKVQDSGIGISKETIPSLFQKFGRAEKISRLHTSGSGLGLYIAKRIVEDHKGRIWVESAGDNKGSTFFVELPIS